MNVNKLRKKIQLNELIDPVSILPTTDDDDCLPLITLIVNDDKQQGSDNNANELNLFSNDALDLTFFAKPSVVIHLPQDDENDVDVHEYVTDNIANNVDSCISSDNIVDEVDNKSSISTPNNDDAINSSEPELSYSESELTESSETDVIQPLDNDHKYQSENDPPHDQSDNEQTSDNSNLKSLTMEFKSKNDIKVDVLELSENKHKYQHNIDTNQEKHEQDQVEQNQQASKKLIKRVPAGFVPIHIDQLQVYTAAALKKFAIEVGANIGSGSTKKADIVDALAKFFKISHTSSDIECNFLDI